MSRRLVTIREVTSIHPIEGADNIELARIDGWQCVVQKGDFQPGQFGVFHEIDSMVPLDRPQYAFLTARAKPGATAYRLRTMRLKGVISQGLLVKIDAVSGLDDHLFLQDSDVLGSDVTEFCGVTLYEPPQQGISGSAGVARVSTFPAFIPKTDLERVQNIGRELQRICDANELFEVTVKFDGTSTTAYTCFDDNLVRHIGVCSRNQDITEKPDEKNRYWEAARQAGWIEALPVVAEFAQSAIAFQGELCGPKIQNNRLGLGEDHLYLFDIYWVAQGRYMTPEERMTMIGVVKFRTGRDVQHVDVLSPESPAATSAEILKSVDELYAKLEKPMEGVVFKSLLPGGPRFKAISAEYLLKYGNG